MLRSQSKPSRSARRYSKRRLEMPPVQVQVQVQVQVLVLVLVLGWLASALRARVGRKPAATRQVPWH
jgi:hypothetical protein